MNAIEAFLAQRTGYCERLRMRLTPEGCAAIRNRSGIRLGREDDDLIGSPLQCRSCPGLDVTAITAKVCVENAASVEATPLVEEVASAPQVETEQEDNKTDSPSEEVIMPEEQVRTMTTEELATLAGVTAKNVCDARKLARMGIQSAKGRCGQVVATMHEHNITWEQIVARKPGKQKASPDRTNGTATPLAVPPFSPWPKAEQTDFAKAKPEYEHYPLSRFTMEEIVGEVVRRVPRAEVVLR